MFRIISHVRVVQQTNSWRNGAAYEVWSHCGELDRLVGCHLQVSITYTLLTSLTFVLVVDRLLLHVNRRSECTGEPNKQDHSQYHK